MANSNKELLHARNPNENPTSEVGSVPNITVLELTTIVRELNQLLVLKSSVEPNNFSLPRFNL